MSLKVGIVGLGIMGSSFAKNLREADFEVCGFDIVPENVEALVEIGGKAGSSPKDVAAQTDVIVTSLPSIAAFHAVMTGEDGISAAENDGLIVVECSTLPIEDKLAAHEALQKVGTILMDCPISGTGSQAINKDLSVYVSGEESAFQKCQDVLDGFANISYFVGEFGNGSKMKYIANLLVHIHNVASAEAMVLGMKAGLDPETVFNVVKTGAGNSRVFELRAPMMVEDNYDDVTMKMEIWQKDIKVISEFAASLQCPTPLFSVGADIYRSGLAKGMDKLDTASVCRVLEQMAGVERK